MSDLLTSALDAVGRGWPVFILGRTKRPLANCKACRDTNPVEHDPAACECLTCHGFYAATTDPARVTAMVTQHPRGLLAVRTGAVSVLVVVDIDPRNGGRLDTTLMPPTTAVATGNHGWHLYYRHPGHPVLSRGLPGFPGVDIKADGGYVVLPPSIHPVTRLPYRWLRVCGRVNEMPPRLRDAVSQPVEPRPGPAVATTAGGCGAGLMAGAGGISSPAALLDAHLAAVARAQEGRRRTTLYGAARGVARMVGAKALDTATAIAALTDAGQKAQQSERDIRKAIAGGFQAEGVPL
ncbi:bifunctional DNA primase/polymerase [Kibdelosporangium aridum]|uniref:Bifunctional DNA primase/polymerase, N-terminal n=1 Tax=Kibdelosporangium aridum TaxID=2030 RepID=A0A1Y5XSD1_KIBAR|nr:bifunctional DNA primase/polymerase [Kibdelosporangium aridum]SMD14194.1 Bifunctional DNA primase/polymerase, N-terminal [Kibdelosporangium aridum]